MVRASCSLSSICEYQIHSPGIDIDLALLMLYSAIFH